MSKRGSGGMASSTGSPLRVDPDLRGQKLDDLAEVVGGPAFDLAVEDAAQAEAGERQRQHDQHGGSGDEADEERVPSHAGSSGTR